ncbi:hypothetical protein C6497_12310 [Candidatus Poribacteria bacterium]|nr:MAG: hypothetical protein C6497_12310 [Candidatus Poribacteria bacterium]
MKVNDSELIRRSIQGDQNAFALLVEKYQDQVHTIAWQKIGDFHFAQEITQDVFMTVYQKLPSLSQHERFPGWLYVITDRKCIAWKRKKSPLIQSIEDTSVMELEQTYYSEFISRQREEAENEKIRGIVYRLLNRLQESERTVMSLFYIAEMTCDEISKFLGISANTVRSRLHRARNRLKKEEELIRESLSSFQLPSHLTENILKEVSNIKPTTSSGNNPLIPLVVSSFSAIIVFLLIGVGIQHLYKFQKPYSLETQSENLIEITDIQHVINSSVTPTNIQQLGQSSNSGDGLKNGSEQDNSVFSGEKVEMNKDSAFTSQWTQTKGPEGGFINSFFSSTDGDIFATTYTGLYKLSISKEKWEFVETSVVPSLNRLGMSLDGDQIVEWKNKLYLLTNQGISVSTNGGDNWNYLSNTPKGIPIGFEITEEGFYIAYHNDIYISKDGMEPWVLSFFGLENGSINSLAAVNDTVFAGTSDGLYRLNDKKWERISIGRNKKSNKEKIHALAVSDDRLYAAVGRDFVYKENEKEDMWWTLFRSTDFGETWYSIDPRHRLNNSVNSEDRIPIEFPSTGTNVAYGKNIRIKASNEKVMVAVPKSLFYSTNTGENWTRITLNDRNDISIPPSILMLDNNTFYRAGRSGIYRTRDGGKSWNQINNGLVNTTVMDVIVCNKYIYARTTNGYVTSSDKGNTWSPFHLDTNNNSVIAKFNDTLYVKNHDQIFTILRLSENDRKFNAIHDLPSFGEVNLSDSHPRSTGLIVPYEGFAISGDTYYVEFRQRLYKWKPGAAGWVNTGLSKPLNSDTFPFTPQSSIIEFEGISTLHTLLESMSFKIAVSKNIVFVGIRDGRLMQSVDEGETWRDVAHHLPFQVESFKKIVFAEQTVYVATDKGVLRSRNGLKWELITDSNGDHLVLDHLSEDGTTVYGQANQLVYKTDENTNIWKQITPEIPYQVSSLATENNTLYVGTLGGGVLRYELNKPMN